MDMISNGCGLVAIGKARAACA